MATQTNKMTTILGRGCYCGLIDDSKKEMKLLDGFCGTCDNQIRYFVHKYLRFF